MNSSPPAAGRLPFVALLGYALVIVYQSLADGGTWHCGGPMLSASVRLSRTDLLANVVAYVPLGVLIATAAPSSHGTHRRWRRVWFLGGAAGVASLSLTMEVIQSCQVARVSSAYDWAANVAGGGSGLVGGALLGAVRANQAAIAATVGGDTQAWLRLVTIGLGGVWVVSQTMPWVFAVDIGTIRSNLSFLRHWGDAPLDPWRIARHAGAWAAHACAWRLASGDVLRAWRGLVLTAMAALGLQLLLDARAPLSFEELMGMGTAVAVALPLMARAGRHHVGPWAVALFCCALASVAAYQLRPDPLASAAAHAFSVWPRVGLGGLKGALDYALLFGWFGLAAVLAAQWAARGGHSHAPSVWPGMAVLAMLGLEVAQTRIPGRGPDLSAPLFTLLAVLAATALVRHQPPARPARHRER